MLKKHWSLIAGSIFTLVGYFYEDYKSNKEKEQLKEEIKAELKAEMEKER